MYRLWERFGYLSVGLFALIAALTDYLFFTADLEWLGFSNYFWVWLAIHQLGFAWRDGRLGQSAGAARLLGRRARDALPHDIDRTVPARHGRLARRALEQHIAAKATLLALGLFQFGSVDGHRGTDAACAEQCTPVGGRRARQRHDHDDLSLAHHGHGRRCRRADARRRALDQYRTLDSGMVAVASRVDRLPDCGARRCRAATLIYRAQRSECRCKGTVRGPAGAGRTPLVFRRRAARDVRLRRQPDT